MIKRKLENLNELKREDEKLDNFLRVESFLSNLSMIIAILFFMDYYVLIKTDFEYSPALVGFGILILVFFLSMVFRPHLDQREKISYCLSRIGSNLEKGNSIRQYIEFLHEEASSEILEDVKEENLIFEDVLMSQNLFWENLRGFALELNHAEYSNNLDKIDPEAIFQLAVAIYERNQNLIELSSNLVEHYKKIRPFPTRSQNLKTLLSTKLGQLLFYESIIVLFSAMSYTFIIQNIETIFYGFCILSAPVISVILLKK